MIELFTRCRHYLFASVFLTLAACGGGDDPKDVITCDPPETLCGGSCVDTDVDPNHCGTCGESCGEGESCSDGACVAGCEEGLRACGGSCVDVSTNTDHCGDCDSPCDGTCEAGVCVLDCDEGLTACGTACVDLSSDDAHCGECQNACGDAGQCVDSACVCAGETELCDGSCVDFSSDVDNCGACGNACVAGANTASVSCEDSGCSQVCEAGFDDCDGEFENGCEADLTSAASCGACGTTCREDQVCGGSGCGCPEGQTECGGVCVDTDSNADHCGACDNSCNDQENSTGGVCTDGSCVLSCVDDFGDCDEDAATGCETPTDTSDAHCGACGTICGEDQSCSEGACGCAGGLTACGTACVDILSDNQNCGGCGLPCDGTCEAGLCCTGGEVACGGACVALDSDPVNCGGCGLSCADFPNTASGTCEDSLCTALTCEENFGDCNEDVADGCEADLLTDADNCGACGAPSCELGCANGSCVVVEQLSARDGHACVLLSGDGSVKCWGSNRNGQIGNGDIGRVPGGVTNIVVPEYVQDPTDPTGRLTGAVQIVTGFGHSCARLSNGTVKCWGVALTPTGEEIDKPLPFYIEDPTDPSGRLTGVADLVSGKNILCALMQDTTVKCWGQMPDGTTTNKKPFPTLMMAREIPPTPISGVSQIALGVSHACGLTLTGEVLCMGNNASGQLGNGNKTSSATPVPVSGLTGVVQLALGQDSTCALHSTGTVSCWGSNAHSQLGPAGGTNQTSDVPVAVPDVVGARAISSGIVSHVCARLDDGTAKCWGNGGSGKLGNGATANSTPVFMKDGVNHDQNLTGVTHIETANAHTCVWLSSGAVQCVGRNNNGQLGNGSTTAATWMTPVVW